MKRVTLLALSLLPMMISSGMIYSVLPIYINQELGAGKIQIGSLFTLGALAGALTSYSIGKLSDRFERKYLILISQASFSIVMLSYSLISSYKYAYPIHIFEGVAWTTLGVSAPALIADITKKGERGEAMGIYNTMWSIGWIIGPFMGGSLSEMFGFRFMLRISFLMILVGMVVSYLTLRDVES